MDTPPSSPKVSGVSPKRINIVEVQKHTWESKSLTKMICEDELESQEIESEEIEYPMEEIEPQLIFDKTPSVVNENLKKKRRISFKNKSTTSSLHVTILTECLRKLQILGIVGPKAPGDINHLKSFFKTHKDLMKSPFYNNTTKYNLDRLFIEDLISTAIKDISINNNTTKFNKLTSKLFNESTEMLETLNSSTIMKVRVGNLSFEVDDKKMRMKEDIETLSNKLGRLKDAYEDTLIENKIKTRYVTKWEEARQFQHRMKLKLQREQIKKDLERTQLAQLEENLIHEQIVSFQTAKMADYWKAIEKWSNKFDIDLSQMHTKIQLAMRDKEFVQDQIEVLTKKYNSQQKEIIDYLIARKLREEKEKLFIIQSRAATKIQAWWRGTMCRHGWGPYRKKKGKKNGKSDKKKK
ncbi:dynein regulatory complex protein 9-like [Onthophagus taurus]|uniref:dynein regulatory complex protein 9-like n=1 Tax=Onthophagus taurus TaxID=166361 RepID=UPI0039BDD400